MTNNDENEGIREKCSSLLAPHFEILFNIVDKLSTRYGVLLPLEFWLALTFSVYAIVMHFFGYSDMELWFFLSLAFLSAVYANSGLIFNFINKIRELPSETTQFLNDLDNKDTMEVEKFLRDFRRLKPEEILIILKSRFCSIPAIHESITRYQTISGEILEYISNNCLDKNLSPDIISRYIFAVRDDVSEETISKLLANYDNPMVKKSLLVSFPTHFKKIFFFTGLAKLRITIQNYFSYGSGDGIIGIPAFLLTIWTFTANYSQFSSSFHSPDVISIIFGVINIILGFFVLFAIIVIVIKVFFVIIPMWVYKRTLYLIAPASRFDYYTSGLRSNKLT